MLVRENIYYDNKLNDKKITLKVKNTVDNRLI